MYRVLIVEDDPALRYIYSKMKAWKKYDFIIASEVSNGKEALQILEQEKYDFIFTDIKMPFIDGLGLLEKLKELAIDSYIALMSSFSEFEYARQGMILGASDYIFKPVKEKNF